MMFAPRPKGIGKDNFLTIADGAEVTGIFRGELHTFKRHWVQTQEGGRSAECSGDGCPICLKDPENYPSFRFRINFVTSRDGKWVAKVFEGGGRVYDMLVGLDKKFDLSKTVVDIGRTGKKQNTQYTFMPRTDQPLSKEMLAAIGGVPLLSLTGDGSDDKEPGSDG